MKNKTLGFLTDYGLVEECVAVCKGVILSIAPDINIIDISHNIPAYDIRKGAFILECAAGWIKAEVLLAVVDPKVGGKRKPIIIQTEKGYLIGPDNGLLIPAAKKLGFVKVVYVTNKDYFLKNVSPTFHGRDIFAPIAAHLLNGVTIDKFGDELRFEDLSPALWDDFKIVDGKIASEVIDIDNFGSIRLNCSKEELSKNNIFFKLKDKLEIEISDKKFMLFFVNTFTDLNKGEFGILFDSTDHLTIFKNQGSAATELNIKPGIKTSIKIM